MDVAPPACCSRAQDPDPDPDPWSRGEAMDVAPSPSPSPSLPDDVLADVLGRLAPRGLAASRCVCKSWRRVVDGRRLLRADLLPLSLGGIFLNFQDLWITHFLSRPTPTTGATVSGRLDYTCRACEPDACYPPHRYVDDHCNGLLLVSRHCVLNPATRQWALLPQYPDDMSSQPPPPGMDYSTAEYLVFDPALSPNYFELVIAPTAPFKPFKLRDSDSDSDECQEEIEWPPSTFIFPVFSSKTGSWEDRTFGREGEAAGMLPGLVWSSPPWCYGRQSAYCQGALYIWYSNCYLLRISLADNKYRAIRLPIDVSEHDGVLYYLGKSVKGIYFAALVQELQSYAVGVLSSKKLEVWFLNSPTESEWVLKHDRDIIAMLPNIDFDKQCNRPWILQEFDYSHGYDDNFEVSDHEEDAMPEPDSMEALVEEANFDWDSDNDDILESAGIVKQEKKYIHILGFHPYKEVVLLSEWDRVLAYHWTSSKIQDLGELFPKFYLKKHISFQHPMVTQAFPYTPCWLGELPEKLNLECRLED